MDTTVITAVETSAVPLTPTTELAALTCPPWVQHNAQSFVPWRLSDVDPQTHALCELVRAQMSSSEDQLPAFPQAASRGLQLMCSPDVPIPEVVKLINSDPAMAMQILRVANSAFYNRGVEISAVPAAVMRLGITEVSRIMTATSIRSLYDKKAAAAERLFGPLWTRTWAHSLTCAYSTQHFVTQQFKDSSGVAFAAGLLHDVGKLPALRALSAMESKLSTMPTPVQAAQVMELLHVEIGTQLGTAWKLPESIVKLIESHHQSDLPVAGNHLLHATRLVSAVNEVRVNPQPPQSMLDEITQTCRALDLGDDHLIRLTAHLVESESRATSIFPNKS